VIWEGYVFLRVHGFQQWEYDTAAGCYVYSHFSCLFCRCFGKEEGTTTDEDGYGSTGKFY
jgi:hypothetical protein